MKRLAADSEMAALRRFTLKSDQDPAISWLKTAASELIQTATGKELVMEDSSVSESQANGLAEGTVKSTTRFIRSLRWAVEQLHGVKLDSASSVAPVAGW